MLLIKKNPRTWLRYGGIFMRLSNSSRCICADKASDASRARS